MEAMLQPSEIAPDLERHEEVFLARYTRLRAWGLQLTENDRERAEDLVHDAYIQFTFTRPDLNTINNLDGYLYSMLRNLHLSQLRRSLRLRNRTLSIVDYDSAEISLRAAAADPREQIRLQDELRQVCQYACMRKETSKAGSVLVLRFLHGYYPREIAEVMQCTRGAVEERLRLARNEARRYLENPKSLRFMRETPAAKIQAAPMGFAQTADELLNELRQTIFDSRQGDCLTRKHLEKLYGEHDGTGVDHASLGHIVSCPLCLDEVNRLLNLPLLIERFPTDTLGTDTHSKGGGGGGGGGNSGGATGGASERELRRCRRRAKDALEHRPAELCISVNGYPMAAQKVGSELSEQILSINVAEKIDFIEVFSEQEIRLLFLCVEELPSNGTGERSTRVQLSDERTLEAILSFGQPWPTLQVVYCDPLINEESAAQPNVVEETTVLPATPPPAIAQDERQDSRKERAQARPLNFMKGLWRWFSASGFWLRPGAITAVLALILISALLFVRLQVPGASAAELLHRSAAAEETTAGNPEVVLHRTLNLEERGANGNNLLARHRIEIWQSASRGVRLRRIYDAQNNLVAGEWAKTNGASTVYRRGKEPQERGAQDSSATAAILESGELWLLDASARDFSLLVGRADAITVEEGSNAYVLSYRSDAASDAGRLHHHHLLRATLVLNKADLRAIEQTLTLQRGGEAREFRFVETGFEQKPAGSVAPQLFQPEPELLGASGPAKDDVDKKVQAAEESLQPAPPSTESSPAVASPELEIEVTYLLNQIKANLGEQVSMTRTTGGALRVEALVETEGRKEEILRALGPVIRNPAVVIEVSTVAEAVKRAPGQSRSRDLTVHEVEVSNSRIPADAELRAYYSARLVGNDGIEAEINRYAGRVMHHSRQALLQSSALKRLVRRFSPAEMRALAPEAQAKWLAMIREHSQSYRREVIALRQKLRPVFNGSNDAAGETVSEANLAQASDRLLQLSYQSDEAVRSAFTISTEGRTAAAIKSAQFWRSLASAEKLAAAIESAYEK